MNLPKSLKIALINKGITQRSLAESVGTTDAHISNLSTGRAQLQGEMLKKIAKSLDMKVSEFVALGED